MKTLFEYNLDNITNPYIICRGCSLAHNLYDYGVCGVIENFLYDSMDRGECSASFNYCDFACDGETIQGCMTITVFFEHFIANTYTFLYEKELNTCG